LPVDRRAQSVYGCPVCVDDLAGQLALVPRAAPKCTMMPNGCRAEPPPGPWHRHQRPAKFQGNRTTGRAGPAVMGDPDPAERIHNASCVAEPVTSPAAAGLPAWHDHHLEPPPVALRPRTTLYRRHPLGVLVTHCYQSSGRAVARVMARDPERAVRSDHSGTRVALSVQAGCLEHLAAFLVMRRSGVRFPKAAPLVQPQATHSGLGLLSPRRLSGGPCAHRLEFAVARAVARRRHLGYRLGMATVAKGNVERLPSGSLRVRVYAGKRPGDRQGSPV
jgi:hypothetical protein